MGVPTGGGTNLGAAQGRIVIDTSGVRRAQAEVQTAARGMTSAFNAIGVSVGAAQLVRFAIDADRVATAYRRQSVAAESLAGSQGKLNELLATYERVTGGAVDRATALADVTRLMAVGFADNAQELERFVTIARGASLAMGTSQEFILSQLQLALANQSTARLDQIGVGVEEFQQRMEELRKTNKGVSSEMLFQITLLDVMEKKFGDLAKSAEANATGVERLSVSLKNLRLEIGEVASGPVSFVADAMANWLKDARRDVGFLTGAVERLGDALRSVGILPADLTGSIRSRTGIGANIREGVGGSGVSAGVSFTDDQIDLIRDRFDTIADIERNANEARVDATRQYEEQRTSTIRQYGLTIVREAEDFARQRARAEQDLVDSIADIRQDAAKREQRAAEDLARNIAQAQTDSVERIADARDDANKRLAEVEEDYQRNRERAARSHRERLLTAAGRLDARAVFEEQRNFALQTKEAEEAHDEQRSDLQEQLQERMEDERENLDKRIRQAQEAHDRQLQDAREADAQRIADMQADFAERIAIEDEDRAIRLERMAADHQAQLDEMATQHGLRLEQIRTQQAQERAQLEEEFNKAMNEAGIRNEAWIAENERVTNRAIQDYTRATMNIELAAARMLGLAAMTGGSRGHPSMADPYVNRAQPVSSTSSGTRTSSVVVQPGAIQISVPPDMNQNWVAQIVMSTLLEFFEGQPQ